MRMRVRSDDEVTGVLDVEFDALLGKSDVRVRVEDDATTVTVGCVELVASTSSVALRATRDGAVRLLYSGRS